MARFPKNPVGSRTTNTIWNPYKNQPFQRHQKFPLAKPLVFHQKIRKAAGMIPQFHNGTFGSFGFFLTSTFPPKKNAASIRQHCTLLHCRFIAYAVFLAFRSLHVAHCIPKNTAFRLGAKSCHWKFLPAAAKERKFPSFENTHFRARIYKCHCWIGVLEEGFVKEGVLRP